MAHGKSQFATWFCIDCNQANYISAYDKRRDGEITKELSKFCNHANCRCHKMHKRKDTKKGN